MKSVVIVGGGIAGLATALALCKRGRELVVLERDPAPPDISPDEAFDAWQRPGVPQFRHAHILLARLRTTLRDRHPELLSRLHAAGIEESVLTEVLPETQVERFAQRAEDDDLLHLWGRRPTFEYVIRRYVGEQPGVRFVHDAEVTGLIATADPGRVRVTGVTYTRAGESHRAEGHPVIDCAGKRSRAPGWLSELGVGIEATRHPSDRVYVCRHYRLKDPSGQRPRTGAGANLDYFGFVTFYAEHGHFALTLSCPVEEKALAQLMSRPEGFEQVCGQVPVLRAWLERGEPTSKVLGAGQFANRWTRFGTDGGAALEGYFPVGDVHIETNPMYGRGCTTAFVQAEVLAEALDAEGDPDTLARKYYADTRAQLQAHFNFCVATDDMFRSQGRRSRGEPLTLGERALQWGFENLWTPALSQSPVCAREMLRAMQMREISPVGDRLRMVLHIFLYGVLALLGRRPRLPALGPGREQAMRTLFPDSQQDAAQ